MLSIRHTGLGAAPVCSPGYYSENVRCPDFDNYRIESDPSGSGCTRCITKTISELSSETCVRSLQYFLAQQGAVSYAAATGAWNPETRQALAMRLPGWEQYPGGACGIMVALQQRGPVGPAAPGSYVPPFDSTPGASPAMIAGIIGGVAVLLFLLKR